MKNRIYFLDKLRVLACFMVCMIHVSSYNWSNVDINGTNWSIMNIYDSIARFSVPIFVMISGYIFLNRNIDYKILIKKHVFKLALAFVIFLGLYYLLLPYIAKDRLNNSVSYKHLWFLLMMILLYLITPILKKIVEDIKVERLFLLFIFIFRILLGNLEVYLNDFDLYSLSSIISRLIELIGTVNITNYFDYVFYYVLGHYLSKIDLNKTKRIAIYVFGLIGFILTIFMSKYTTLKFQTLNETYYQNFMINVLFETLGIFVLFKYSFNHETKNNNLIVNLSNATFGVYLIHIFIIHLLAYFGLNTLSFSTCLSIPLISLLTFIISSLLVIIFLKLTMLNNK